MQNEPSEDILAFYQGQSPDSEGRMIETIWSWDYKRLEDTHDYIQWLFPLKQKSGFNRKAPVLNDEIIQAFKTSDQLKQNLRNSLQVMLRFYGLQCSEINNTNIEIIRSDEYQDRKLNWLNPRNHNYLRITRILTSLRILGLENYAQAFFNRLSQIYLEEGQAIGNETYAYWERAASSL
jgi:hypothetical protein